MCEVVLSLLEQSLIFLPLAIGSYIIISLMKVPNLSLQSAFLMGAVGGSLMVAFGQGLPFVILAFLSVGVSLLGGALVGLVSSIITQKGRVPHLLSSIVTLGIFHGVLIYILNGSFFSLSDYGNPLEYSCIFTQYPELMSFLIIGVILISLFSLLLKTELGYSLAIYGDNPAFFEHYRISTGFVFMVGSMLSNALAGLSGYLFAQSSGFVELAMGVDIVLLCIMTLILGRVFIGLLKPVGILIPILGIILYCFLQQLIVFLGFNLKYFSVIEGLIILIVVIYKFRKSPKNVHSDQLGV